MNTDDFTAIVEAQVERSTSVLISKAKEYASETDRLANFKTAAALQGITASQALAGMMAKHTQSVYAMIMSGQAYTTEMWNEKITDHINYLLLLRAVVEEEHNNSDEPWQAVSKTLTEMLRPEWSLSEGSTSLRDQVFSMVSDIQQTASTMGPQNIRHKTDEIVRMVKSSVERDARNKLKTRPRKQYVAGEPAFKVPGTDPWLLNKATGLPYDLSELHESHIPKGIAAPINDQYSVQKEDGADSYQNDFQAAVALAEYLSKTFNQPIEVWYYYVEGAGER